MITIVDVKSELAKLGMLRDRRPDMLEEERQASGAFKTLAPFSRAISAVASFELSIISTSPLTPAR